jgi:hypothetical protein
MYFKSSFMQSGEDAVLSSQRPVEVEFTPGIRRRRILVSFFLLLSLVFTACTLEDILGGSEGGGGLSTKEIIDGLKEALKVGITNSAAILGVEDGYFTHKIVALVLPEDVSQALDHIEYIEGVVNDYSQALLKRTDINGLLSFSFSDFHNMRDSLHKSINRAAERAAPLSVPIFKKTITEMTIADGKEILYGDTTAATEYLREKTFTPLTELFSPEVDSALSAVKATQLWESFSTLYNELLPIYNESVPILELTVDLEVSELKPLTTSLGEYTTQWALIGLFYVVGEEEAKIRRDPVARITDILKKVFGVLDE